MFQAIFLVSENGGHFPLELTETFSSRSLADKRISKIHQDAISYARSLDAFRLETSLVKVLASGFSSRYIDKIHFSQVGDYSKLAIPVDWTGRETATFTEFHLSRKYKNKWTTP